jgi:transposase
MVHLNSVEQWRQRWNEFGLVGLYEGRHTGRPRKWTLQQRQTLGELAQSEGGTVVALLRHIEQRHEQTAISERTATRYLKEMNFTYKRYRYSLKKRNQEAFERASKVIGALGRLDHARQCELLYFDESGFSPNPPVQYGWSQIEQTRSVERQAHRQRVNVLGALRHDGWLTWVTQQRPTMRDDVIAFFDQIAAQPHSVPRIVLLDNAAIHKGDAMQRKRRLWAKQGLHLYYLPP